MLRRFAPKTPHGGSPVRSVPAVTLRLPAGVLLAGMLAACGTSTPQAQDACPGFVDAYNQAGDHVKAGLGGDSGFLLENSLRHDGDAARAAAASATGPAKIDLIRFGQALDNVQAVVHAQPGELGLLAAGTAFVNAKDQVAKDCDYTLAEQK